MKKHKNSVPERRYFDLIHEFFGMWNRYEKSVDSDVT